MSDHSMPLPNPTTAHSRDSAPSAPAWSYVRISASSSVPSCRVLSVCREPVNSMNAQLWRELGEAMAAAGGGQGGAGSRHTSRR